MCGALAYSGPSGSGPDILGAFCFCMFGALAYSRAWCVRGPRVFGALACSGPCRASPVGRFAGVVGCYGYFLGS